MRLSKYQCPFGPNYVLGLSPAAWFRAGVGQTVTGSGVSTWADQSGNGRDLLQGTDAARPALQADGSVLFNGTSHYLKTNAFTLNQPETVYIAFKQVSWTLNDYLCDGGTANTGVIYQKVASPRIDHYAGTQANPNTAFSVGAYGVVCSVFNGALSLLQVNNTVASGGNAGALNMGGFTLGADGGTPTIFGNIQVLEVILAGAAHSAEQRARVIQYLSGRHGIAL